MAQNCSHPSMISQSS